MKRHTIRLTGPRAKNARLSAQALRDLLDAVIAGARHAVRLRVEGRGLAGPPPSWLERISDLEVLPAEAGSTIVVMEAPTLAGAAPERFAQSDFLLAVEPDNTCIDVMEESLCDALAGNASSDRYDGGLLETFARFDRLWRYGIDCLEMDLGGRAVRLDASGSARLANLQRRIPPEQRVEVVGKLDQLHHSKRMFTLRTDDGKDVRGVAGEDVQLEQIGHLFGQRSRIAGTARFRPSGEVLLIEAELIEPAEGTSSVFSRVPKPLFPSMDRKAATAAQGPKSGIAAIFGRWPGDESDEEIQAFLDELS